MEIVGPGEPGQERGHLPFTPRAKKVMQLSMREAIALGHAYIGTEHILLGLIRADDGVATRVLNGLGVDPNRVRQQVAQFDQEITQVRRDKESAIDAQDFENAAVLRDREQRLLGDKAARLQGVGGPPVLER